MERETRRGPEGWRMPGVVTGARGVEVAERGALVEKRARGAEGAGCGVERGKVPEVWRVAERGTWSEERARGVEGAGCGARVWSVESARRVEHRQAWRVERGKVPKVWRVPGVESGGCPRC